MRTMEATEERKCYECGEYCFGNGIWIGDDNKQVPTRCICKYCAIKLGNLAKKIV
jgi:hypothetical protein